MNSENNLPTFQLNAPVVALMTTEAFSQNVAKIFSKFKLVTDNLSLHVQQPTEKPLKH